MKELTDNDYKTIIARRDKRFDGQFYFGVKTTHIYCRPVCPARPKLENILVFRSASEAESKGYRACLRCHPDRAPGHKIHEGTANTISRALRMIQNIGDAELQIPQLAESLGISDRHLRRLFDAYLGASPIEIVTTQRLHFSKQLVQESGLPMTEIAFAAGFRSIRQFNDAFKAKFQLTPSEMRNRSVTSSASLLELKLPIRLPYDWESVMAYLKRHETYGIECVENSTYRRFIRLQKGFGIIAVRKNTKDDFLTVCFENVPLNEVRSTITKLKSLFDTDHNPAHLPFIKGFDAKGIRVPGCFNPFETAVSLILSQLVSTEQAKQKLRKLVEVFGKPIATYQSQPVFEFPMPYTLAAAKLEVLGLPRVRAQAIRDLAKAVDSERLSFNPGNDFAEAQKQLRNIKGIGPWTAAMIGMRCFGDPDAFPASDLIVKRAVEQKIIKECDWNLSRAYLTHCLWRDYSKTLSKQKGKKQ